MKISVCIATYNGEKYIAEQLQSILVQLEMDDEVIISDDSSTDNTIAIIESYKDDRIKIYPNQKFRNPIFNFEHAFKQAKNEFIFISDQDDLWVNGKVEAMKEYLKTFEVVVCDHSIIDDDRNILISSYFGKVPSGPGIILNMKKNTYYGCCMAFQRKVLFKALPFPKGIPMHDIWIGFVTDIYFKAKFINIPYTLYRKHDRNASTATNLVSPNGIFKKVKNRIDYLKYFPLLVLRFNKKTI